MDDNNHDLFSKQNQNNDNSQDNTPSKENDAAGSILRKERVTKRITIDSISKDLKINSNYIKAIEENNYNELPADPYIRVYIKSIASYLMLNPDEILDKFYKERGIRPSSLDKKQTQKIDVTEDVKNTSPLTWIVIISIIVILAVLSYIGNRFGLFSTAESISGEKTFSTTDTLINRNNISPGKDSVSNSINDNFPDDTTLNNAGGNTNETDTKDNSDTISLKISVEKDSAWVHVFYDGDSWQNFLYKNEEKIFTATDSINANIGKGACVNLFFNESPVELDKSGVVILKADHNGVDFWPLSKWKVVFKNRI